MDLTRERLKVAMALGAAVSSLTVFAIAKRTGLRLTDVDEACGWLVSLKYAYALSETEYHAASDEIARLIRTCQ